MNYEDILLTPQTAVFQAVALLCNLLPVLVIFGFFGYQWFIAYTYRQAYNRHLQGDIFGALRGFNRLLRFSPRNAAGYYGRSLVQLARGDYDAALDDNTRAVLRKPRLAEFRRQRGMVYLTCGQQDKALEDFNEVLRQEPENTAALNNRGQLNTRREFYSAALDDFTQAITLLRHFGTKAKKFAPYMGIRRENMTAISLQLADALIRRGHIYEQLGEVENAALDFAEAERIEIKELAEFAYRASAYHSARKYERALADYNKVLEISPNLTFLKADRAEAYFALGQLENALDDFKAAYTVSSVSPFVIGGLSITYHALGQVEDARRLWELLLAKDSLYRDADWVKWRLNWAEPLAAEARRLITSLEGSPQAA